MASKTIYLTVRIDIENSKVDDITDEQAMEIADELDYEFKDYEDFKIDSEICGCEVHEPNNY